MSTTPTYAGTVPGQQLVDYQNTLNKITGAAANTPPATLSAASSQLGGAAANMQANAGTAVQNAQSTLSNEAGIPALNSDYSNLAKIFQLYQADQSLASKYSNGQNPNPYANSAITQSSNQGAANLAGTQGDAMNAVNIAAGNSGITPYSYTIGQSAVPNPYLGDPATLAQQTFNTPGPGFSTPGLALQASAQPAKTANDLLSLINSLTSTEQGIVNQKTGDYSTNYKAAVDMLNSWAQQFGSDATAARSGSGSGTNSAYNAASLISQFKGKSAQEALDYAKSMLSIWNGEGIDGQAVIDYIKQAYPNPSSVIGATSPGTITPKTSTSGGKSTVTGWTIKYPSGSSKFIANPQASSGGFGSDAQSVLNFVTGGLVPSPTSSSASVPMVEIAAPDGSIKAIPITEAQAAIAAGGILVEQQ